MGTDFKLDYYHGDEPDKFSFIKVPIELFTKAYFEELSLEAKVLYALMHDQMTASRENRWVDDENRVYILFSIQRAMAYLNCGKEKAIKVYGELDTRTGIGLIERIDRGQGKADLIYVKSFEVPKDAEENAKLKKYKENTRNKTFGPKDQKLESGEAGGMKVVGKTDRSEKPTAIKSSEVVRKTDRFENTTTIESVNSEKVVRKTNRFEKPTTIESVIFGKVVGNSDRFDNQTGSIIRPQEVGFSDPNKTDYIQTKELCDIDSSSSSFIPGQTEDGRTKKDVYIDILKNQIQYDYLIRESPYTAMRDVIDSIISIIADTVIAAPTNGCEQINGRPYPHDLVVSRYMKMDYDTIKYVLDRFRGNTSRIRAMAPYLRTALYNARDEMELHLINEVNRDMHAGGD